MYFLSTTLQVLGANIAVEPRRETVGLKGGLALIWLSGEDCAIEQPYYAASVHTYQYNAKEREKGINKL